jgi:hypothetical protein
MDDSSRLDNLRGYLSKLSYLKPYKYDVIMGDQGPVVKFESLSDQNLGRLNGTLRSAGLTHIAVHRKAIAKK